MTWLTTHSRRLRHAFGAAALAFALTPVLLAEDAAEPADSALQGLSAEAFLQEVRRPFRQEAWGEATGSVQYVSDSHGERRGTVRLRITFSPESLHAQLVLNDTNVYGFEQKHAGGVPAQTKVDLPEKETPPGLFDFGIEPEDLTFAFIYWDLKQELPGEDFRRRPCRVMELVHPRAARVWFSASHGYPLKAEWYSQAAKEPWRTRTQRRQEARQGPVVHQGMRPTRTGRRALLRPRRDQPVGEKAAPTTPECLPRPPARPRRPAPPRLAPTPQAASKQRHGPARQPPGVSPRHARRRSSERSFSSIRS